MHDKKIDDDHPSIDNCDDDECMICAIRDCPTQHILHYHHDGCPDCQDDFHIYINSDNIKSNPTNES